MNHRNIGPLAKLELTPREQAEAMYQIYRQPRCFKTDCRLHKLTGYVIDTGTAFLMGRAVWKDAPWEALRNPQVKFHESICDAWLIWIFAGDVREMFHLAPYYLPYVGWSRRNGRIRWYETEVALSALRKYGTKEPEFGQAA